MSPRPAPGVEVGGEGVAGVGDTWVGGPVVAKSVATV